MRPHLVEHQEGGPDAGIELDKLGEYGVVLGLLALWYEAKISTGELVDESGLDCRSRLDEIEAFQENVERVELDEQRSFRLTPKESEKTLQLLNDERRLDIAKTVSATLAEAHILTTKYYHDNAKDKVREEEGLNSDSHSALISVSGKEEQ